VSPHRDIFYCFGCHKGGDVVAFIAQAEHCTPLEAVRHLAERYAIALPTPLEREVLETNAEKLRRYVFVCTTFAQWCHEQLFNSPEAHAYVRQRGLTDQSINGFTLGYCPGHRVDAVLEALGSY
jgi:DNA primase